MAYSNDFRLKVVAAVDRGESQASVARRFEIGERTVRRFKRRRAETGDVSVYKTGPKEPMKLTADDDALMREQVRGSIRPPSSRHRATHRVVGHRQAHPAVTRTS